MLFLTFDWSKYSSFSVVLVAEQINLSETCSQILKWDLLANKINLFYLHIWNMVFFMFWCMLFTYIPYIFYLGHLVISLKQSFNCYHIHTYTPPTHTHIAFYRLWGCLMLEVSVYTIKSFLMFYYTFFLQEIQCNSKMVVDFQPKIKTMTGAQITVPSCIMELGGMVAAIIQI